ncbi:hypothetical protein [Synechococcus phage Ssp-JY42]
MALLDNGQDLDQCAAELGAPVGQLLTPLTRYNLRDPTRPWAMDNGGFKEVDVPGLLSLLAREARNKASCLFVAVPDVVGCARRTLEVFERWKDRPELEGWPLALVLQDGQEDLDIPWDDLDAVFVGGSTRWKLSEHVGHIVKAAKVLGKRTHAGRVNDPARWQHFEDMKVDTADGTGLARYTHMREAIARRSPTPTLFDTEQAA